MKNVVFAASALALAAGAQAAPFTALSYEAGGGLPGIVGAGFSVSAGGFWTASAAGNNVLGGSAGNFSLVNFQEHDSHFSLDPFGPTARNRTATTNNSHMTLNFYGDYGPGGTAGNPNPGHPSGDYQELETLGGASFVEGPGSHVGGVSGANLARAGIAVSPPPVPSGFAPNMTGGRSAFDGIFVARFTVHAGETVSGGMLFNTVDPNSGTGFFGAHLVLDGPGVPFSTINGIQVLALRSYKVGSVNIFNEDEEIDFGQADVYDLWVQLIPTPGAMALFGMGGLAMLRRRRA